MTGKSPLSATKDQQAGLACLACSRDRGEAERARAVPLTLAGWTSGRIAEAFGVREDTVRLWRADFMKGDVDALKTTLAPGPAPVKSEVALRVAMPLLAEPVADRPNGTIARLRAEIQAREGVSISRSQLSKALRKKFRWRRPRHTLKERQVASAVERVGLRLPLLKQQADAGDILAPGQAKKVAILGSFEHKTRHLSVPASKTRRGSDFVAHLERLDRLYGPKPGQPAKPAVLVENNGPIHTGKPSRAALAARAHWLTVEWLPQYAPELNNIEAVWRDLKAHHLAHQTFADADADADADALDQAIHDAVEALNSERMPRPLANQRTSA